MKNAIEIKGLCKSFGDFALDHIDLTLPGGSIMGLIGENGAGKSTTIKCILNLVRRDGGEISVFGLDNLKDERAVKGLLALGARQDEARQLSLFDEPERYGLGGTHLSGGAGVLGASLGAAEGALPAGVRLLGTRETALTALTGEM